jgi:hypothetical protein
LRLDVSAEGMIFTTRSKGDILVRWKEPNLKITLRDGAAMPPGLGSYVGVPCVVETGRVRAGIPTEAFLAIRQRAGDAGLPEAELPRSPFGRIVLIGSHREIADHRPFAR